MTQEQVYNTINRVFDKRVLEVIELKGGWFNKFKI